MEVWSVDVGDPRRDGGDMMPPGGRGQHPPPQGLSCFFLFFSLFFDIFLQKDVGKKVALKIQSILLYFLF